MTFSLLPEESTSQEKPSIASEALRHTARTGSRIAEQFAGTPGDILSFVNDIATAPLIKKVTGKPTLPYEKTLLGKVLPPTSEHRKRSKATFGEYTEPQNKVENFSDNLISDATAIFSGGITKKAPQIFKGIWSSVLKSIGANVAKETVTDFTKDERKGAFAHLGALALLSFIDKKSATSAVGKAYAPLQDKVKNLSPVSAIKAESTLQNLKSNMMKGTQAPSEQFIIDEVDKVLSKIKNGKISPEEAWASKRSINEKTGNLLFSINKKDDQKRARKLISIVTNELDDVLKLTAKQDPKFYKDLKSANAAFKTIADSNLISKWIENNAKYTPLTAGLLHTFGGSIGKSAGALILPYEVTKVLYRISKSPMLAKHYAKTIASATKENAPIFNRNLKILDKELQKSEKKDKFSLVED